MWRLQAVVVLLLRAFGKGFGRPHLLEDATRRLIREAKRVEVYSLDYSSPTESTPFQGAKVLGSALVEDRRTRTRLIDRILFANKHNIGGMKCLGAEYGVRIETDLKTLEVTFCFDCSQVWVHGSDGSYDNGTTASYPVEIMNRILKRNGVPLPPQTH